MIIWHWCSSPFRIPVSRQCLSKQIQNQIKTYYALQNLWAFSLNDIDWSKRSPLKPPRRFVPNKMCLNSDKYNDLLSTWTLRISNWIPLYDKARSPTLVVNTVCPNIVLSSVTWLSTKNRISLRARPEFCNCNKQKVYTSLNNIDTCCCLFIMHLSSFAVYILQLSSSAFEEICLSEISSVKNNYIVQPSFCSTTFGISKITSVCIISIWAVTCHFHQCGILTSVDSDVPVYPPFKLRNSKWCSVSSLTFIEYSSDKQSL